MKISRRMVSRKGLFEDLYYGVLAMEENHKHLIKNDSILGKNVLKKDALENKDLANSYWKLDGNAFDTQPAPKFMKDDTLIFGGCPVTMMLPKEKTEGKLVEELEAGDLGHIPIGFMDLHKISDGKFSVSGLGIAKPYQDKGLSKYLIYGGAKMTEMEELTITTQLSNPQAHYAWLHLSPLKIKSADVFHNEPDTVIYKAEIPEPYEEILEPLEMDFENENYEIIPAEKTSSIESLQGGKVVGYKKSNPENSLVINYE